MQSFGGRRYNFHFRETTTYEVLEDVSQLRSEIGVLALNEDNERYLRRLFGKLELEFTELIQVPAAVYIARTHPLAGRSRLTLEDLKPYPCITFEQGEHNGQFFFEGLSAVAAQAPKSICVRERATEYQLIRELHGFSPDERTGSKSLDSKIEALDCIDAVMKCLKVKVDLDVEALTDQNLRDLHTAHRALIGGELLHRSNKSAGMCLIKLPGFSLKFLLYDKGNDDFLLMDALDVDPSIVTPVLTDDEGAPVVPVPPLLIQTEQELLELGNIDSETFEETCESFPISGDNSYYVNNRMLDLIAAADNKAVCANELLKCAAILVERLEPFTDPEITTINRLQIKKRVGCLTSDDEMSLASLVATGNSLEAKACAAILRNDETQANVLIGMLPPERANELRGWPVYHLLEKAEVD